MTYRLASSTTRCPVVESASTSATGRDYRCGGNRWLPPQPACLEGALDRLRPADDREDQLALGGAKRDLCPRRVGLRGVSGVAADEDEADLMPGLEDVVL